MINVPIVKFAYFVTHKIINKFVPHYIDGILIGRIYIKINQVDKPLIS